MRYPFTSVFYPFVRGSRRGDRGKDTTKRRTILRGIPRFLSGFLPDLARVQIPKRLKFPFLRLFPLFGVRRRRRNRRGNLGIGYRWGIDGASVKVRRKPLGNLWVF